MLSVTADSFNRAVATGYRAGRIPARRRGGDGDLAEPCLGLGPRATPFLALEMSKEPEIVQKHQEKAAPPS